MRRARTTRSRLAFACVPLGVVILAVAGGCDATTSTTADKPPTSSTGSSAMSTPFTITARYSAGSLGVEDASALAIGPDDNLYLTDISQRVTVVSPAGTVLRRWGKPGSGPAEFRFVSEDPNDPKDIHGKIAVGSNGMVYVADSGNGRIQVFTAQGSLVRQFGSFGDGKGQFLSLFDIAVDDTGNVFVTDSQRLTLTKFASSGKVLWQTGGSSAEPDLVGHLHLNGIDAHGRLVIANDDKSRIAYVDSEGHEVDSFGRSGDFPGGVCEVTVDAFGYTYVTGCGRGGPCAVAGCAATFVFDRAHRIVAQWPGNPQPLLRSPVFGPNGEAFALCQDGSVLRLHITLPRR